MLARGHRLVLFALRAADYCKGRRGEVRVGAARQEESDTQQRTAVQSLLQEVSDFFTYYVKGRIYEWTMAFVMFFSGLELLIWEHVLTFGAFGWLLLVMSQKLIGVLMLFIGWTRISSLMFNGQLLFGHRFGFIARASCAVLSAVVWAQFSFALLAISINQGFPSIGLPLWTLLVFAELLVAYSVGAEWKK